MTQKVVLAIEVVMFCVFLLSVGDDFPVVGLAVGVVVVVVVIIVVVVVVVVLLRRRRRPRETRFNTTLHYKCPIIFMRY